MMKRDLKTLSKERIWWLHDAVRLNATPSTPIEEPNDLYAMPVEELLWRLENREEM